MAGEPDLDALAGLDVSAEVAALELPAELKAVTDEAQHQVLVCPSCKTGDSMTLRQQISSAVTRVERKLNQASGYRLTMGEIFDATAISVYCRACGWGDMEIAGGDPWKALISEPEEVADNEGPDDDEWINRAYQQGAQNSEKGESRG